MRAEYAMRCDAVRAICDSAISQPTAFGIIWRQFSDDRAKDCSNKRNGSSSDCCPLFMLFVIIIGGAVIDSDDVFFACFFLFLRVHKNKHRT